MQAQCFRAYQKGLEAFKDDETVRIAVHRGSDAYDCWRAWC